MADKKTRKKAKRVNKACADCGCTMYNVNSIQRYCSDCIKDRKRARDNAWKLRKYHSNAEYRESEKAKMRVNTRRWKQKRNDRIFDSYIEYLEANVP